MRYLITCWGTLGEILPFKTVAETLFTEGHEVYVAAPELFRSVFTKTASGFSPLPPAPAKVLPSNQALAAVFNSYQGTDKLLAELIDPFCEQQFRFVQQQIEENEIDRAFTSWITPAANLACQSLNIPFAQAYLYPQALFQQEDLPVFMRWWRFMLASRSRFLTSPPGLGKSIHEHYLRITPRLKKLQRHLNYQDEELGMFPLDNRHSRKIALFPPVLLRQEYKGLLHCKTTSCYSSSDETIPEEVKEFIDTGCSPVLVNLGSIVANLFPNLIKNIIGACLDNGERVICITGPYQDTINKVGPHALFLGNLYPPLIMPRVKAVIHHGGMGILQHALDNGLPSVCLPQAFDQLDNALRLEDMAAGTWLSPNEQTRSAISRSLAKVLDNKTKYTTAMSYENINNSGRISSITAAAHQLFA